MITVIYVIYCLRDNRTVHFDQRMFAVPWMHVRFIFKAYQTKTLSPAFIVFLLIF